MVELEQLSSPKGYLTRGNIEVRNSHVHRYGVFATKDISPKEIIEECPAMVYPKLTIGNRGEIARRQFFWNDANNAIALGYGSIYNHADEPNARYLLDRTNNLINFIAIKPIASGEEIFVDYGDYYWRILRQNEYEDQQRLENNSGVVKFFVVILILFILFEIFPVQLAPNPELLAQTSDSSQTL